MVDCSNLGDRYKCAQSMLWPILCAVRLLQPATEWADLLACAEMTQTYGDLILFDLLVMTAAV